MNLIEFIKKMPKAELHVHLEGAISPATLLTLAERNKIALPYSTPGQIETLFKYKTFKDFVQVFLLFVSCLRKPEDFNDVTVQLGEEMNRQNIRYAEITWTPQFYSRLNHSLGTILEALNHGRMSVKEKWGIEMRWTPDLVRSVPGPIYKIMRWASRTETQSRGVVALGLGGPEKNFPAAQFKEIFAQARHKGLPANPHAGENEGPNSVWSAIQELKASRIGHGVRSIEDKKLVSYLIQNNITLEVCPTSNLLLNIYPSYAEHPLKKLVEAGCPVTINTDDPTLFQTTLTDEYLHAVNDCGLTIDELRECVLNAVRASYLNKKEKDDMLASFQTEFNTLQ